MWDDVKYQPGVIKVIAYKNGKQWAADEVKTTGAAAKLELTADRNPIAADGVDLVYVTVKVQDAAGLTVPGAHPLIQFELEGAGELVATDNGDATSLVSFQSHEREAFNGLALVIVKAHQGATGGFKVKATSKGLAPGEVSLHVK